MQMRRTYPFIPIIHPLPCMNRTRRWTLALSLAFVLLLGQAEASYAALPATSDTLTPSPAVQTVTETVAAQNMAASSPASATDPVPTRLRIPVLGVDAAMDSVGRTKDGSMMNPSEVGRVAWYNVGPQPGAPGNAVVAGHLDDYRGRPAVFWDLDKLAVGDEVIVDYADGSSARFLVYATKTYAADDAPLARIFGVDFERDLNLITCEGDWNATQQNYTQRLVVYTRLAPEGLPPGPPPNLPVTLPVIQPDNASAAPVLNSQEHANESATPQTATLQNGTPSARTIAPA